MPATHRIDQKERTAIVPMDALRGFFHIMDAWGVRADDARVLLGSPAERTYLCLAPGERCPCADGYPSKGRLHRWNLQGLANRLLGRASGRQLGQTPEQSISR